MIRTNWHTHTKRCGRAKGEDEEYVLAAIEAGIRTLGFSDHAPYLEPLPSERMKYEELPEYLQSIASLKEKYKDQINIFTGLEAEYYPDQWEQLTEYRKKLDYMILGQHSIGFTGPSSYRISTGDLLMEYVDCVEQACIHGLCDYVAHPDVAMWGYPQIDGSVKEAAERLARISLKYNMPMELNCGSGVYRGLRQYEDMMRYGYPTRAFFEVFAQYRCPVIIGLDIHDPERFKTDMYLDRAMSVIADLNCNILYDFDLVKAAETRKKEFF